MYLVIVIVAVDVPSGVAIGEDRLHRALRDSAADTDRLQHHYLQLSEGKVVFSIYLQALDRLDAVQLAEQLCRRTMAAVAPAGNWMLRNAYPWP